MKRYIGRLQTMGLFKGINPSDLETMLRCLGAEVKAAPKGEILLLAGDKPEYVGVVLSGQLHIIKEDSDGNRSLLTAIAPGGIFGEALCCAGVEESPVTVLADIDCAVMLLRFTRILHTCGRSCEFHTKLIGNMLGLIAEKNLMLQSRMEIVSLKSIREKVTRYLESLSPARGEEFAIPFNREEMADYLCVDRSALSHELAKMKRDGIIEYQKNRFCMIRREKSE